MNLASLLITALVLGAASFPSNAQPSAASKATADDLVFMGDEEPAMKRAFERARASLDDFLSKAKTPPPGLSAFSVNVGVRQGKEVEYFWINDFSEVGDSFEGEIGNTPQMVKTVKLGQRYRFTRGEIVDWLYIDRTQRKMVGNFTYCALLTKESRKEAEASRKRFNFDCET